jgi:hypothetical protein
MAVVLAGAALVGAILAGPGCRSTPAEDGEGTASVTITNRSVAEIRDAALATFTADGYSTVSEGATHLVFEKKGSGMTQFLYGDFVGGAVWIRVRTEIMKLSASTDRLQCEAFRVEDYGDRLMEREHAISKSRSSTYQKLLDKVKQRLQ